MRKPRANHKRNSRARQPLAQLAENKLPNHRGLLRKIIHKLKVLIQMEAKQIEKATPPELQQQLVDRIKAQQITRVLTAFRKTNKIIVNLKNRVKLTKGVVIMIEAV
jgi:hypothetical protein